MSWFLTQIWPTMFHTLIAAGTGAVAAVVVVAPIKKGLHSMGHRLGSAIDSLDPDIPVGLTKQLDDANATLADLKDKMGGTLTVHPIADHEVVVRK